MSIRDFTNLNINTKKSSSSSTNHITTLGRNMKFKDFPNSIFTHGGNNNSRYNANIIASKLERIFDYNDTDENDKFTQEKIKDNTESPKMPETVEEWAEYGCKTPAMIQAFSNMEPKFQEDVIDLMNYMKEQGWTVRVEKAKTGGTDKGKLGGSNHGIGVAIDIHFIDKNGKRNLAGYNKAGEYWTSKGEEYRWLGADDRDGAPYEEWHFDIHKDSYYQYLED